MRFCGLKLDDTVPDHSVLSHFGTILSKAKAWGSLLEAINKQLSAHKILLKQGAIIDATDLLPFTGPVFGEKVSNINKSNLTI